MAIKSYMLFRIAGPKQIFQTSRNFTVTTIANMTMDELDAIENMFGIYLFNPEKLVPMLLKSRKMLLILKIMKNFNRRLKLKKGRVLCRGYLQ